jgi:hypothetical protein
VRTVGFAAAFAGAVAFTSAASGSSDIAAGTKTMPKASYTAQRLSISGRLEGVWAAHALIVSWSGGNGQAGEQINRVWSFRSKCGRGRCALYWTRLIDLGVFTAAVHVNGSALTATFANERTPCTSAGSRIIKAIGLLTSTFTVRLRPDGRLYGTEHTYATTRACSDVDHRLRWAAIHVTAPGQPATMARFGPA